MDYIKEASKLDEEAVFKLLKQAREKHVPTLVQDAAYYKQYVSSRSFGERVESGAKHTGAPSALLTGGFAALSGTPLRRAAKLAVGTGLVATVLGTMLTPKQKRTFIRHG